MHFLQLQLYETRNEYHEESWKMLNYMKIKQRMPEQPVDQRRLF